MDITLSSPYNPTDSDIVTTPTNEVIENLSVNPVRKTSGVMMFYVHAYYSIVAAYVFKH